VELNHAHMGQYLDKFFKVTEQFLSRNNEDEEDKKVAQFSIELWSILCEVEVNNAKNPLSGNRRPSIIRNFNWQGLATILLNGL